MHGNKEPGKMLKLVKNEDTFSYRKGKLEIDWLLSDGHKQLGDQIKRKN